LLKPIAMQELCEAGLRVHVALEKWVDRKRWESHL
jgi:hypothetical protein